MSSDGLDVWCYDALETRVFADGSAAITVLRSLEVVSTWFDSNPACHVARLTMRVTIEDYLARTAADDGAAIYLRSLRVRGSTTHIVVESPRRVVWRTIDGAAPDSLPEGVPGDHHSGLWDEAPPSAVLRAVVAPGRHLVRCQLDGGREVEHSVEIARGERLVVTFD